MNYRMIVLLPMTLWFTSCTAGFFDFFKPQEETLEQRIDALRKKQIDHPEDPQINYNLGVALYKQKLFDQAEVAFQRAVQNADDKTEGILKLRSLFNGANSGYQTSLRTLPVGWQTQEYIDDQVLNTALTHVNLAIDYYKKALEKNPLLYQAQKNMKLAEELKKQLEEKRKKQQQNPNKQEQQQNKQQQQQAGNNDSSSQKQTGDDKGNDNTDQKKDAGKDRSDESKNQQQQGKDDPDKNKKDKDAEQQNAKHDKQPDKNEQTKTPTQDPKQAEQEKQANDHEKEGEMGQGEEGGANDDKKESAMARALLDSIQNDEAQSQKRFTNQQLRKEKPIQHPGQKPW